MKDNALVFIKNDTLDRLLGGEMLLLGGAT